MGTHYYRISFSCHYRSWAAKAERRPWLGLHPPPPPIGRRQGVLYSRRGCIGIDRYMEVRRQPLFPGPALTSATADRLRHADRSTASVHMEKRDLLQVGRLVLAYSTEVLRLG